ncbi:hypothetical protein [Bradyrhizobium sp. RDM4]|uniref:hypothetical protein n=1 Tax=Bradyrhizobium sp. RDM4 TaxID=3378765 RepID=UPI0038FCB69F
MNNAIRHPNVIDLPAALAGELVARLAIQQRARETALRRLRRLRKKASAEIDRLIAFLDASDPYVMTELEDDDHREDCGDSEPSLGSLDRAANQTRWGAGCTDDSEHDRADDEPSLGSLDHRHSQERWAAAGSSDREDDPTESGIADHDGLLEQIGHRDWQHTVMA